MSNRDPYLGLRPYHFEESDLFFGRKEYINLLADKLQANKFIVIMGNSGCGKSSLVRAGLLPTLMLLNVWHVASFRPLNAPFQNAAKSILKQVDTQKRCPSLRDQYLQYAQLNNVHKAETQLEKLLREKPESLHELIPHILPDYRQLLIIVDQFEELFRYENNPQEVDLFVQWLLKAAEDKNTYVVITIRHEYVGECIEKYPALFPFLRQQEVFIPPLTHPQLSEAIAMPAEICGGTVDAKLVERLLESSTSDQLPLLQYSLMRMWNEIVASDDPKKHLTVELYEKLSGDLGKILSDSADSTYDSLSSDQKYIAEILFRRLTQKDDKNNYTRSTVMLSEVAQLAGKHPQTICGVVERFRDPSRRFLLPSVDGSRSRLDEDSVIDIAHESLIRQWGQLQEWVDAEYDLFKNYEQIDTAAFNWQESKFSNDELILGTALKRRELWLSDVKKLYRTDEQAKVWAKRYGGQFQRALDFLAKSREKQAQQEQTESVRRKALEKISRQRTIAFSVAGVVIAFAGVVSLLGYAVYFQKNQRTIELFESQRIHAALSNRIGDYVAAQQLLTKTHQLDQSIDLPPRLHARNLLESFTQLMSAQAVQTYQGANAILYDVAVSPDGKFTVAVGETGTIAIFDNQTGQLQQSPKEQTGSIRTVAFDPKNQWFVTGGDDKKIIFWSLPTKETASHKLNEWVAPDEVQTLAVTPDGKKLVSGGTDKNISVWDIDSNAIVTTLTGHTGSISSLAFNTTGNLLASASYDNTARLWDMAAGKEIYTLRGHTDKVQTVTFVSPEDTLLATGGNDNTIRLWDVKTGQSQDNPLKGHTDKIFGISPLANGKQLVSASNDGTLRLWDIASGVTLRVLQGHTANVSGVTMRDDQIFSVSTDGTVKRWNADLPHQQRIPLGSEPSSVVIAPDAKTVAVGFVNGDLRIYPLPLQGTAPQPLTELTKIHEHDIQRLAFNSKGNLLATGSRDCTAKLWRVENGKLQPTPLQMIPHQKAGQPCIDASGESTGAVSAVAFSPDDKMLVTASYDGKIGMLDIATKKINYYPVHDGKDVNTVAFDATGTKLLTAGDEEIHLWNVQDFKADTLPKPIHTMKQAGLIWASLDSQAQRYVGIGRGNFSVNVYRAQADKTEYQFSGHNQSVIKAIFSPDNQQVATASADGTVRFWDLLDGSALFSLRLPTQKGSNNFSPLWDFDFRCADGGKGQCWLAVPLTRGELMLYDFGTVYTDPKKL